MGQQLIVRAVGRLRGQPPFLLFVCFVCFVVNHPPSVLIREIRGFRFLKFGCGGAALGNLWLKCLFVCFGCGFAAPGIHLHNTPAGRFDRCRAGPRVPAVRFRRAVARPLPSAGRPSDFLTTDDLTRRSRNRNRIGLAKNKRQLAVKKVGIERIGM
jgi:hypothetical protein